MRFLRYGAAYKSGIGYRESGIALCRCYSSRVSYTTAREGERVGGRWMVEWDDSKNIPCTEYAFISTVPDYRWWIEINFPAPFDRLLFLSKRKTEIRMYISIYIYIYIYMCVCVYSTRIYIPFKSRGKILYPIHRRLLTSPFHRLFPRMRKRRAKR